MQPHSRYNRYYSSRRPANRRAAVVHQKKISIRPLLALACVLVTGVMAQNLVQALSPNEKPSQQAHAATMAPAVRRPAFPAIDTTGLSATQKRLLAVAQAEYAHGAVSGDQYAKKYSEGFDESWCADFVSWMRNEAGVPFAHPDTQYWRIPGVATLRDYFVSSDAYHMAAGSYTPKLGDIAFYFGVTPDGSSREHVAMVLEVKDGKLVTIGGNEGKKGEMKIRSDTLEPGVKGLAGFGELRR